MIAPPVVCVFGISGVGKTTLIRAALVALPSALHLQASTLIKQGLTDPVMESERLRLAGGERILANQQILTKMFQREIEMRPAPVVVFDGHLVIDAEDRLVEIPREVIAALNPRLLVHVEDLPEAIVGRRQADQARRRAERLANELEAHQAASRRLCAEYSAALKVDMLVLCPCSAKQLVDTLKAFPSL